MSPAAKRRPAQKRATPKPAARDRRTTRSDSSGARVRWSNLIELANERSDSAHQRFFRLETFARAVERFVATRDTLFAPALALVGQTGPPAPIAIRLVDETAADLRFLVQTPHSGRGRTTFILFVAKNSDERSTALRHRWKALQFAALRAPESVVRPLSCAKVFLPDRHRRKALGREIFCYLTLPLESAYPLGVSREGRFCTFEPAPKLLSTRDEAALRVRLLELACRLYDPKEQTGLRLPDLAHDQLVLRRKRGGEPEPLVMAPDGLRTRLTVPRFLSEIVAWEAKGAGSHVRIAPESFLDFFEGIRAAVGADTARDWLTRYKRSVMQKKLPPTSPVTPNELSAAGIE